jgi:hypothetical protein
VRQDWHRLRAPAMTERMSVEEFKRRGLKANKFGAKTIVEDGMRFESKLEARRYLYWKNLWQMKAIAWFTRQVPFYLPGGIIWRADFLVVWDQYAAPRHTGDDELVTVEDCKGVVTRVAINKIKQVEAIYGFKVQIIKKGEWR